MEEIRFETFDFLDALNAGRLPKMSLEVRIIILSYLNPLLNSPVVITGLRVYLAAEPMDMIGASMSRSKKSSFNLFAWPSDEQTIRM